MPNHAENLDPAKISPEKTPDCCTFTPQENLGIPSYLAGRPVDAPLWPGSWVDRAAEMLRIDLEATGIAWVVEGPDGPLFADFHSLRHSFVALLDQTGATLKASHVLSVAQRSASDDGPL